MQSFYIEGFNRILHPDRDNRPAAERILANLGKSNYGVYRNEPSATKGLDSFELSGNLSELLSPACGMTEEEKSSCLAKIMAKLKSGKRLTPEEMRFLQAEEPTLYQQAARVASMRDSLESRLKHCASKEEASDVYMNAMSSVSKEDPMKEFIIAAYDDVYKEFQGSDEYRALPEKRDTAEEK